jgi:3-oxoacyl-[acyl-carrier protein] reductase
MASTLAAQRIFAREQTPEDMVGALLFLLGPGSDFVTGQNISVNGGRAFS